MMADPSLPRELGKYRILGPLGRGGMAQVYRAYHPQLDRQVAIKVLRSELIDDGSFLSRFRREAQAIAALRHPHIVQVYDFDVQNGVPYMVMELLEGDTLKTRLHDYRVRGKRMPLGETVRILLDVLDGLGYAHDAGVVHRDIKPSNILLTRDGEAVLADFGIAQILGGTRQTASGAVMGTLSYIAPEQGLEGRSDVRSDVYSLGVVAYEMLTEQTPFDASTPLAALVKHLNDPVTTPRDIAPDTPKPLEGVVVTALAKDPAQRYQSANEMAVALREAMNAAGLDIPESVSVPASPRPVELHSELVQVLSRDAREGITDAEFARDVTHELEDKGAPSGGDQWVGEAGPDGTVQPRSVGWAIWRGIALVLVVNLAALTVAALADRWPIYVTGWPIELLLVGAGLSIIMSGTRCIWLLIPVGILLTNGLLLSYTSLTGRWAQWQTLGPLAAWLTLCVVVLTLWLARRGNNPRRLSRWLGQALGWIAAMWSLVVAMAATLA